MSKDNPFKKIESEGVKSFYADARDERVRSGVNGTLGTVRFVGKVADVYLGRLMETMVGLTGGTSNSAKKRTDFSDPQITNIPPNLPQNFKMPENLNPDMPQGPLIPDDMED